MSPPVEHGICTEGLCQLCQFGAEEPQPAQALVGTIHGMNLEDMPELK